MKTKSFAVKLKLLRKEKGYTQNQLADMLGVARTSISNWEKGIRQPNMNVVTKIAAIFDISVDYLILSDPTVRKIRLSEFGANIGHINNMA